MLRVGAEVFFDGNNWVAEKAIMSRSARRLMQGNVFVPGDILNC